MYMCTVATHTHTLIKPHVVILAQQLMASTEGFQMAPDTQAGPIEFDICNIVLPSWFPPVDHRTGTGQGPLGNFPGPVVSCVYCRDGVMMNPYWVFRGSRLPEP